MKYKVIKYFLPLVVMACNIEPQSEVNENFKKERESRQIKRVTEGQLVEFTFNYAKKVADTISKSQDNDLINKITAYYQLKKIEKENKSLIREKKTRDIFEAYEYNAEKNIPLEDNLQKISKDTFLFTRAIKNDKGFHGLIILKLSKKEMITNYSEKEPVIKFN